MIGTTTQNRLSIGQKMLMIAVWLGVLGVLALLVAFAPNGEDSPVIALLMIVLIIVAFVATFRITTRANGKSYVRITSTEGVRGEFSVGRVWPAIGGYLVGMLTMVCIMGLLEEVPGSRLMWGWALTAIIPLSIYGLLLLRVRGRVTAFRVEDDGSLSIRRANAEWKPFRITDYGRVVGRVMTGRGVSSPSQVDFLDPVAGQRTVRIPLMLIRSREYKTATPGIFINDFFRDQCQQAGYRVQPKGKGWVGMGKK